MSSYREAVAQLLHDGEALIRAGRHAEAEACAQRVLAEQPRNPAGNYVLGLSALLQHRHADALGRVESALRIDRTNAQFHFMAGLCLSALARLEEAVIAYRRALQYRPDFFEARANLGYLHECAGRLEEAATCYRTVLTQHPQEWYSLNRLGYCERMLDRPELALRLFDRALTLQPQFAPTENERALALLHLERKDEAIAAFRRAVEMDPSFLAAWCNLGKVLYLDHVTAGAAKADAGPVLECFEKILALEPDHVEFTYLRDCLQGARVERPPDAYIRGFFDRFAPHFEQRVAGDLEYSAPRIAREVLVGWLAQRRELRVLDLGCGTGLSGEIVRDEKAHLVGVDLSSRMLEIARGRAIYDELVEGEIVDYVARVQAGSVDLVLALDVLIYVGQLDRVLSECARALAPRGKLIFTVEALADANGDFALAPSGRYSHARDWVTAAVNRAGLEIEATRDFAIRIEANRPVAAILFDCSRP